MRGMFGRGIGIVAALLTMATTAPADAARERVVSSRYVVAPSNDSLEATAAEGERTVLVEVIDDLNPVPIGMVYVDGTNVREGQKGGFCGRLLLEIKPGQKITLLPPAGFYDSGGEEKCAQGVIGELRMTFS